MKNLVIILIALVSLSGCDRVNPKNYPFYCKIDGKEFVPEKDTRPIGSGGAAPYRYELYPERKIMAIYAKNSPQALSLVVILPNGKLEKGEYVLSSDFTNSSSGTFTANISESNSLSYSKSGWVRITQADENGRFSGEFEFTTYNEYLGRTVKITEGKFRNK